MIFQTFGPKGAPTIMLILGLFLGGGYEVFAPLGGIPEEVARRITELTELTELTN